MINPGNESSGAVRSIEIYIYLFFSSVEIAAVTEFSQLANRPSQFGGSESETGHFLLCVASNSFPVALSTEETVVEAGSAAPIKYQQQSTDCCSKKQERRMDKETH